MCIIALNKSRIVLFRQTLNNCWSRNKDGAGMLYSVDGKLEVFKSMSKKKFIKEYFKVRKVYPDIDIVLHFRYSTHGKNNIANTHPHLINENLGFVHNGIIDNVVDDNEKDVQRWDIKEKKMVTVKRFASDKSDSALFAKMLGDLPEDFLDSKVFVELIENYIGNGNKLVFLDKDGKYTIVNEEKGVWDSGCWFSNLGYLPKKEIEFVKTQVESKVVTSIEDDDDDPYSVNNVQRELSGGFDRGFNLNSPEIDGDGCCKTKDSVKEDEDKVCDYCFSPLYGINEMRNMTCNGCFKYFTDNGGYG